MNPDKLAEGQVPKEEEEEEEEEYYMPGDSDEEDDDDDLEYEYDSEYESESSTDSEEGLNVTVRTVMGQEFNFLVSSDSTVIDLKMAIFVNLNRMHPDTQVLNMLMQMVVVLIRDHFEVADHILQTLILLWKVLTYLGEEMEEDEETMADYDIQVDRPEGSTPWSTANTFPHFQDGSTILLQPKLASGFISHPNR